jgi:hypothetical protein
MGIDARAAFRADIAWSSSSSAVSLIGFSCSPTPQDYTRRPSVAISGSNNLKRQCNHSTSGSRSDTYCISHSLDPLQERSGAMNRASTSGLLSNGVGALFIKKSHRHRATAIRLGDEHPPGVVSNHLKGLAPFADRHALVYGVGAQFIARPALVIGAGAR